MRYCTRCGEQSRGTKCRSCGRTHGDVRTDGGQGPNNRRQGNQNNQPPGNQQPPQGGGQGQPQGGGQGQPRQGQPPQGGQPQQGQPQGQQPRGNQRRGPPPQQGDDGFSRRQLLIGGGGAVALLGGGWFFFLRDDGAGGPEGAVQSYYSAIDDGDYERAAELTHEDSPERGGASVEEFAQVFEQFFGDSVSISVESTEVVDEDIQYDAGEYDNVQQFEAVEVEATTSFMGEGSTSTETVIVAQNSDGEWKIWETGLS